jgi:hypothetical protein
LATYPVMITWICFFFWGNNQDLLASANPN